MKKVEDESQYRTNKIGHEKYVQIVVGYPFYLQNLFSKEIGIQLSRSLKNYMPEICLNVHKVDYEGAEGRSFLINVNVGS